jgi:hypothetical protein
MITKISPNYNSDYLSDDSSLKKIDVFSDRVNGWFLDWADNLNDNKPHAGFAVLHLSFSYFEFISIFMKGEDSNNRSKAFFKEGIKAVFPELNEQSELLFENFVEILYKKARCGFFHSGMAKKGIILKDHKNTITFQNGNVFIDRYKFVKSIRDHFNKYISNLKNNNSHLIDNFLKAWDIVNS